MLRRLRQRAHASRPRVLGPDVARYNAFVSYSHEADARLAPALRSALHAFARPWRRLRALRIFVDTASLAADPGLWPAVERALDRSEFLLLLASPQAAASSYVQREAEHWRATKPDGRILIALTGGELVWDDASGDFDWDATTALPKVLRGAFSTVPLWVDLRWARDAETLGLRDDRFRDDVADLASPMHGRDKDELSGEDVRQHRRAVLLARGAVTLLVLLAATASAAAVLFLLERNDARQLAELALSRQLAAQSELDRDGQIDRSLLLAVEATHVRSTGEARAALLGALQHESRLVGRIRGQRLASEEVAFSADGKLIAVGNHAGQVRLFSAQTRAPLRTLTARGLTLAEHLSFSPDGDKLAASGEGRGTVVFDLRRHSSRLLEQEDVQGVDFSPDGRLLATGGFDKRVLIWNARTLERDGDALSAPLAHTQDGLTDLAFDGTGRRLVASSYNGEVVLWDVARRRRLASPRRPTFEGGLVSVAIHGDRLAAGGAQGTIALWRLDQPTVVRVFSSSRHPVASLDFSADGGLLAAADGTSVTLWSPRSRRQIARFATGGRRPTRVAFSSDRRSSMLATTGNGSDVLLWRRTAPVAMSRSVPVGNRYITALALSPDGQILAAAADDGALLTSNAASGAALPPLEASASEITALRFSSDGDTLLAGHEDGTLRVLNPRTGRERLPPPKARAPLTAVALGDETMRAASADARVWSRPLDDLAAGWSPVRHLKTDAAVLSADATVLAGLVAPADDDDRGSRTRVWKLPGWEDLPSPTARAATQLALTSDGGVLAVAATESVTLWDVGRGRRRGGPLGASLDDDDEISAVGLSDDARLVAAADRTGNLFLWDMPAAVQLGPPLRRGTAPTALLVVSGDGSRLAVTSADGVLLIDLAVKHWERRACTLANRVLLEAERRQLLGDAADRRAACAR